MILLAIVVLPLIAGLISVLAPGRTIAPLATLAASVTALALSVAAAASLVAGQPVVAVRNWVALDGFGALILLLTAALGSTAALFSWGYIAREKSARRLRRYYTNYNLFVASMLLVPVLIEPNLVWTAVELTTVLGVYLVAFENTREALEAGWKYSVLTIMGGAIALLGFLAMFAATSFGGGGPYTWQRLLMLAPAAPQGVLQVAFVLILVGFGAKAGLVPLHTWLPDAHSQAPSPICALLSGIKTTLVLYVILRFAAVLNVSASGSADVWATVVGLSSVAIAAFLIIQVTDYKRLFAFSTVEHMGIILTAAGIGGAAAHYGAVYQILNHALTKSFCFFAAGAALLTVDTRQIAAVHGLIRRSPAAGAALLLGGVAIAGAPPLAVFLSEFSILRSAIEREHYLTAGLLAAFVVIGFFGTLYHLNRMTFGRPEETEAGAAAARLPTSCLLTLILAGSPVVLLGLYMPKPLALLLRMAADGLSR
jgi:hydrogenase-4 component F